MFLPLPLVRRLHLTAKDFYQPWILSLLFWRHWLLFCIFCHQLKLLSLFLWPVYFEVHQWCISSLLDFPHHHTWSTHFVLNCLFLFSLLTVELFSCHTQFSLFCFPSGSSCALFCVCEQTVQKEIPRHMTYRTLFYAYQLVRNVGFFYFTILFWALICFAFL